AGSPSAPAAEKSVEPPLPSAAGAEGKPAVAVQEIPMEIGPADEITLWQGDRRYRVRGLGKNTTYEVMKVNVLVSRQEEFHADTFDMNIDRQRAAFIKRAAEELNVTEEVIRKDVGRLFLALERRQVEAMLAASEPAKPEI